MVLNILWIYLEHLYEALGGKSVIALNFDEVKFGGVYGGQT